MAFLMIYHLQNANTLRSYFVLDSSIVEPDPTCGEPCAVCPTCDDEVKNGNEDGVDCGGPCTACPSCSDQVQNQGETNVDCGGPCTACPTCSDGVQNQDEVGVDCGGRCTACSKETVQFLLK